MTNILLSYPRSGNTWLRYCVESITQRSTIGYQNEGSAEFDRSSLIPELRGQSDPILIKRHFYNHIESCDRLILVVRNYKESVLRHNPESKDNLVVLKNEAGHYMSLLNYYEVFQGPKLLIYYKDLITNFIPTINRIMVFLGKTDTVSSICNFSRNIEDHKTKSIDIYSKHAASHTHGNYLLYHSNNLSKDEKLQWDSVFREINPSQFDKYLSIFKENNNL